MNDVQNDLMKSIGEGERESKRRKDLSMGGGGVGGFAVGIVIAKFAFSSPKQDTEVILPPEIKNSPKPKKEETQLFNTIPIEKEKNSEKTETKIKDNKKEKGEEFKKPLIEDIEENKETVENIKEVKVEKHQKQKETPKNVALQTEKNTKLAPPKIEKIEKVEPTKIEKVTETKGANIKQEKQVFQNSTTRYPYFIQVAAVTRGEPSKKFLKLIEKNKFNYKIQSVEIKGVKVRRVLIGGFKTLKEAKTALPEIKKKISSSAFIKKLK